MKTLVLIIAGLFFVNFASQATQNCTQETDGRQFCISGETMKCTKKFDLNTKAFKYELDAITTSGQAISVNSPLYKKTAGYTPMSCADSNSAKN
jgi:hypothetical protein